ncbi:MAG TPA: chalcone isomerase family protein, partial [Aquabacterium sp.]|nr:chalcone isomerase family protein [Aquabacterium sp.]
MKQFLQRGLLTAMTAAALLAASGAMAAQTVAGVSFEDQLSVADQPLVLNGVGLRVKMIIKVYAMGLYVPRRDTSAVSV